MVTVSPPHSSISPFIIQWKPDMHRQCSNDLLYWGRSGKINLKAIYQSDFLSAWKHKIRRRRPPSWQTVRFYFMDLFN